MMVYFKLMMVKCSLMMVKCSSISVNCSLMIVKCSAMMVKWVYDHTLFGLFGLSKTETGAKTAPRVPKMMVKCSLVIVKCSSSLTCILPSLPWSKSSFVHLTIIENLHRLHMRDNSLCLKRNMSMEYASCCLFTIFIKKIYFWLSLFLNPDY